MKLRVTPRAGIYQVDIMFNDQWQRTSIKCDNYYDAWGELISVRTGKPYIKYQSKKDNSITVHSGRLIIG